MLLVAYLRQRASATARCATASARCSAPMIRRSDNAAGDRVRDIVGNAALVAARPRGGHDPLPPGRRSGACRRSRRATRRGSSCTSTRFLPRATARTALRLLRTIVPSQRWGIGAVTPPGWTLYFKGGWGSGSGAVDHQVGLLQRGEDRVAIAVLTLNSPSHDYGKATLRGVAKRLLRGLDQTTR